MVDVPSDLSAPADDEGGWMVFARPLGTRCLVIAGRGETVCRDKNGFHVCTFDSGLPGGVCARARASRRRR